MSGGKKYIATTDTDYRKSEWRAGNRAPFFCSRISDRPSVFNSGDFMLSDRYGYELTTTSQAARDAYVDGMDRYLAADVGVNDAFDRAIAADENFALPYVGKARNLQTFGDTAGAKAEIAKAQAINGLTSREQGQVRVLSLLIHGKSKEGFDAAKAHLADYPRDVQVAQTCLGVLSLIGLSGLPGREATNLAFAEMLHPHYGDDWWFQTLLAFAQMECGLLTPAERSIEIALEGNPRNANAAHYRSHLYYENGETDAGLDFLDTWWADYDRSGMMNCHIAWHVALWSLARGDIDRVWQVVDENVDPAKGGKPPVNVVSDMAAVLYRAELAGYEVAPDRWKQASEYAAKVYPKPGLAFVDVHAAVSHAMAGNSEALERIMCDARGPAADIVKPVAEAFGHIAAGNWQAASEALTIVLADHARVGGSRAQRDLFEYAMANALMKLGRSEEARRLLAIRRPNTVTQGVVVGV